MKYLTLHETTEAYEAAASNLEQPHIALTLDDNAVHYHPLPPTPQHEYVEIGGIKWAKTNVGAASETDYGNYYQYGKGSAQYAATSGQSNYSGLENPLFATADTATQEWGGDWHIPTKDEILTLTANADETWETDFNGSGVNGVKFTDKTYNSKYIFIPAAGYYRGGSRKDVGKLVAIWSSTPQLGNENFAYRFTFQSSWSYGRVYIDNRYNGYSVRPVLG